MQRTGIARYARNGADPRGHWLGPVRLDKSDSSKRGGDANRWGLVGPFDGGDSERKRHTKAELTVSSGNNCRNWGSDGKREGQLEQYNQ